jgi:hypothetical protein
VAWWQWGGDGHRNKVDDDDEKRAEVGSKYEGNDDNVKSEVPMKVVITDGKMVKNAF